MFFLKSTYDTFQQEKDGVAASMILLLWRGNLIFLLKFM